MIASFEFQVVNFGIGCRHPIQLELYCWFGSIITLRPCGCEKLVVFETHIVPALVVALYPVTFNDSVLTGLLFAMCLEGQKEF